MRRLAIGCLLMLCVACGSGEPAATPAPSHDPVESFEIDGRPAGIAVLDDHVFVADDEHHDIHVLDARSGETVGEPIDVERNPVAVAADDGAVWVGHAGGELTKIDAATRKVVMSQKVAGQITDVVAESGLVYIVDLEAKGAAEIDPDTGGVNRGATLRLGAVRGAVGKEALWVSGTDRGVSRIELVPFVDRHDYPDVGGGPIGLAWDGEVMWAAVSDDGTIVDIEGRTYDDPIEVGSGPVALAVLDGSVYVVNQDDETLVRVRDGKVVGGPVELGTSPRDVVAAGDALWVAGVNPSAVVRVAPGAGTGSD